MKQEWTLESIIKIITPFLTLLTVIVGIYQFNTGQKENKQRELMQTDKEILSKFKENQNKVYAQAMEVISYLVTSEDYKSKEYVDNIKKFNQLYWVQLPAVQTSEVESSLDTLRNSLENLRRLNYSAKIPAFDSIRNLLPDQALSVSIAIRKSAIDYSLPQGLKGIGPYSEK